MSEGVAPSRLPQGLLLLIASSFCLFVGAGFVSQTEAVLFSFLGYALLFSGGYMNAAGAVLLIAGAYWLFAAIKLFVASDKPLLEPRCFVGGHVLLFLGVLCFAAAAGKGYFAADPSGEGMASPVLGATVMAAGLYWLWTAYRLLGGDGKPAADLRNFVGGHVMLAASITGFAAVGALFDLGSLTAYIGSGVIFTAALFWLLTALRRLFGKPPPSQTRFVAGNILIVIGLASSLWRLPELHQADTFASMLINFTIWSIYFYLGGFLMMGGAVLAVWPVNRQEQQIDELLAELRKEKNSG